MKAVSFVVASSLLLIASCTTGGGDVEGGAFDVREFEGLWQVTLESDTTDCSLEEPLPAENSYLRFEIDTSNDPPVMADYGCSSPDVSTCMRSGLFVPSIPFFEEGYDRVYVGYEDLGECVVGSTEWHLWIDEDDVLHYESRVRGEDLAAGTFSSCNAATARALGDAIACYRFVTLRAVRVASP